MSEARKTSRTSPNRVRRRSSDLEVYEVARLVCEKGLTAPRVAARLYPDEYGENRKTKSRAIMRVKHLLSRALATGVIRLRRPRADLVAALRARPEFTGIRFDVVDDRGAGLDPTEPVYREAARLVARRIHQLMLRDNKPVIVANAGGWGLSRLTEYLPAVASSYEDARHRLQFISLNALRSADSYHLSANYVAVRMAAIFGGRHLARLKSWSMEDQYQKSLLQISLLICGAGSRRGFLSEWLADQPDPQKFRVSRVHLPTDVVGDICLIPINQDGEEVRFQAGLRRRIQDELRPRPDYDTLKRLAADDKVLLVLAAPIPATEAPAPDPSESLKIPVSRALLRPPLTKWCVIGSSMAEQLLSAVKNEGARKASV